jgi:CxxC motif-containing protein (DUF1111 family)
VLENERAAVEEILGRIAWNADFKRLVLERPEDALKEIGISFDDLPSLDCTQTCRRTCKASCQVTEALQGFREVIR